MANTRALTDEHIANLFIRGKAAYGGVMEVVYIAARLEAQMAEAIAAYQKAPTSETIDQLARQAADAAGMRRLIVATVARYRFTSGSFGDEEIHDQDGTRSRHIAELLLQHAAEHNRQQDDPTVDVDEDAFFW